MKITTLLFSLLLNLLTTNLHAEEQPVSESFSDAELEQMLAPVALYPDSLLTHVLIASTYPLELVQANRWVSEHAELSATEARRRVESKSWDPSVKALVPFPAILDRLSHDLDWTRHLGEAFLQDEERLLASVQSLRHQADKAGNLKTLENMEVVHEQQDIIIQPVERQVIYVPYYDTRVVYGIWRWPHYPPVYWDLYRHRHYFHTSYYSRYRSRYFHGVSWYPRVYISSNFFFGLCNWRDRQVVVVDYRHHYLNRFHDRRAHRRHLIHRGHAKRWRHNIRHRKGVAYRNNNLRKRFDHNRIKTTLQHQTRRTTTRYRNHRNAKKHLPPDTRRKDVSQTRTHSRKNETRRQRPERREKQEKPARKYTAVKQQYPRQKPVHRPVRKSRPQTANDKPRKYKKPEAVKRTTKRSDVRRYRRSHRKYSDR